MIVIAILIVIFLGYFFMGYYSQEKKPALYDRLGGVFNISAVVNKFSDSLVDNPIVGRNSKNSFLADWHQNHLDRLPGLKFMRTLWLCAVSGGPFQYSPTRPGKCPFSLENAHSNLHISPEEFDEVAKVLSHTLDDFKVPEKEKMEVLSAFSAHKSEINMGFFVKNKIPPKEIVC